MDRPSPLARFVVTALVASLIGLGCWFGIMAQPPGLDQLIGTYDLCKGHRCEVLVLRADGSFTQEFDGASNAGSWRYTKSWVDASIDFNERRVFFPEALLKRGDILRAILAVRSRKGSLELVVDPDDDWAYVKRRE